MKKFHLSDVLTITTGRLVSTRHMDGVYDILNYMTGEELYTHQLVRAMDVCRPELLLQHPKLEWVSDLIENPTQQQITEWLGECVARFGEELEVVPLEEGKYQAKDPIVELEEMVETSGKKPEIIVIQVKEE